MDSENQQTPEEGSGSFNTGHFYVCADAMPDPELGPTAWIQRVTMLAEQMDDMCAMVFRTLEQAAPILIHGPDGHPTSISIYLAGVGYTARETAKRGKELLAKLGVPALDPLEEQKNLMRAQIAKPDCPAELRDHLLEVLGQLNNLPVTPPTVESDFPEEGFTIGEDG